MSLFVDTGVFFAAAMKEEPGHAHARQVLIEPRLVTTAAVLVELWSLAERKQSAHLAELLTSRIMSGGVRVENVGEPDLRRAMEIGEEYPDQAFSLVDRTSFVVMHRLGLYRVASFDHHFAVYRFGPGRRKAFEIAR